MDSIDPAEERRFQELMEPIFGKQVFDWKINIRVLELFEKLIKSSAECSRQLDLVPRPFYFGSSIRWANKQARAAVRRALGNVGKHYLLCLRAAGLKMKTEFLIASRGA